MKKAVLFIVCLCSAVSFGQMTMKKLDGTPINDGDVLSYSILGDSTNPSSSDPAYLGFKIYNSSASAIRVRMKLVSMSNANGSNLQFCIDPICVGSLTVGNSYPSSNPSYSTIPANGQNGNFDHFVNSYAGNGIDNVEYVLKFYMVDTFNAQVGNAITITYRYSPTLGIKGNDLKDTGISVTSTVVDSQVAFNSTLGGQIELYDLNGRMVHNSHYVSGYNTVDMSRLNAAVYVLSFISDEGKKASIKVIKK